MKKIISVFAFCVALVMAGCNKEQPVVPPTTDPRAGMISMAPAVEGTTGTPVASATVKLSPLELAQKQYLDAYNEYVRLLRESGPQTIDTLQALAIYQKQYQIYQMLLKAHGDKAP